MTRFVRIANVCVLALTTACGGSNVTQPPGTSLPMVRLRSEPYSFTFNSGLDRPARLVVRDAVTWRAIWTQIYARQSPVPTLPSIDFSSEMLVVVALGSHSTGGYSILLRGASEGANNGIAVIVDSNSPGSNRSTSPACHCAMALSVSSSEHTSLSVGDRRR
jgi:hypothetical protein